MKIKIYLFRLTVAATAFLLSLGGYAAWRYVQSPFLKTRAVLPEAREISAPVVSATINAPVSESAAEVAAAAPPVKSEFDPEGYYYIADETLKGFEDFENFSLINKNYESENPDEYGKLIAPKGAVTTKKEYKFVRVGIGGGQIQFETERVKGISYSFSGYFTETGNFLDLESEAVEKVLKGRLIKKRQGKTIAERDASFGWYLEPGCGC